MLPLLKSRGC